MPTAKEFSFSLTLLQVVVLTDMMNDNYNEAKSPAPGT